MKAMVEDRVNAAGDPLAVRFWGIMYGSHHQKTGERIVPSYAVRKRLQRTLGVPASLDWWRCWAGVIAKGKV